MLTFGSRRADAAPRARAGAAFGAHNGVVGPFGLVTEEPLGNRRVVLDVTFVLDLGLEPTARDNDRVYR